MTATAAANGAASLTETCIETVSTDSRRVGAGVLFVALHGVRHDGHAFAAEALRAGAAAVLVDHVPLGVDPRQAFVVRDTLHALGEIAAYTRRRWGGPVAAITGSNGKTTTKEMLASICAERFEGSAEGSKGPRAQGPKGPALHGAAGEPSTAGVSKGAGWSGGTLGPSDARTLGPAILKTHANENNLIGLPLTLLRLTGDEAVAVLEMGMNVPGEIARMTEIATPDVGLITNVGAAHLEGLGSIAGIAAAKAELIDGLRPGAAFAVNMDDEWVVRRAAGFRGRRIEFGSGREVSAGAIADRGFDGIAFTLQIGGRSAPVALRMAGRHNVQNALGAAAAAHALGIGLDAIAAGLAAAEPPKMRMQVVRLANGVTLVNDAYNANPSSTEMALDAVGRTPGRAIAVLGEMRELGADSAALHRHVGAHAAACGVDWLLAVGPQAEHIADGAKASPAAPLEVTICPDAASAAALLAVRWLPGDTILIKGSRGPDDEEGVRRYGARMAEVAARLEAVGSRS